MGRGGEGEGEGGGEKGERRRQRKFDCEQVAEDCGGVAEGHALERRQLQSSYVLIIAQ